MGTFLWEKKWKCQYTYSSREDFSKPGVEGVMCRTFFFPYITLFPWLWACAGCCEPALFGGVTPEKRLACQMLICLSVDYDVFQGCCRRPGCTVKNILHLPGHRNYQSKKKNLCYRCNWNTCVWYLLGFWGRPVPPQNAQKIMQSSYQLIYLYMSCTFYSKCSFWHWELKCLNVGRRMWKIKSPLQMKGSKLCIPSSFII